ncbi:MAG: hypothetical protein JW772_00725 [Candidatus Diapherotrites archaeon]|nr:hypothetical protein [Candidatus Diapherotrites archaeon]
MRKLSGLEIILASFFLVVVVSLPFWVLNISILVYLGLVYAISVFVFKRIKKELSSAKNLSKELKQFLEGGNSIEKISREFLSWKILFPILFFCFVCPLLAFFYPNSYFSHFSLTVNEFLLSNFDGLLVFLVLCFVVSLFLANNIYYYTNLKKP